MITKITIEFTEEEVNEFIKKAYVETVGKVQEGYELEFDHRYSGAATVRCKKIIVPEPEPEKDVDVPEPF